MDFDDVTGTEYDAQEGVAYDAGRQAARDAAADPSTAAFSRVQEEREEAVALAQRQGQAIGLLRGVLRAVQRDRPELEKWQVATGQIEQTLLDQFDVDPTKDAPLDGDAVLLHHTRAVLRAIQSSVKRGLLPESVLTVPSVAGLIHKTAKNDQSCGCSAPGPAAGDW